MSGNLKLFRIALLVLFTFVVAPLISMAVMALSVGIIRLIQRSRVASFLLLGSRWKN